MEIFGKAIDDVSGQPLPGASVQRRYPDTQVYSSPVIADSAGDFNGRVPDGTYSWLVTLAGYHPKEVSLTDAPHNRPDLPIIVRMRRSDLSPTGGSKKGLIIAAVLMGLAFWKRNDIKKMLK